MRELACRVERWAPGAFAEPIAVFMTSDIGSSGICLERSEYATAYQSAGTGGLEVGLARLGSTRTLRVCASSPRCRPARSKRNMHQTRPANEAKAHSSPLHCREGVFKAHLRTALMPQTKVPS